MGGGGLGFLLHDVNRPQKSVRILIIVSMVMFIIFIIIMTSILTIIIIRIIVVILNAHMPIFVG